MDFHCSDARYFVRRLALPLLHAYSRQLQLASAYELTRYPWIFQISNFCRLSKPVVET